MSVNSTPASTNPLCIFSIKKIEKQTVQLIPKFAIWMNNKLNFSLIVWYTPKYYFILSSTENIHFSINTGLIKINQKNLPSYIVKYYFSLNILKMITKRIKPENCMLHFQTILK